MLNCSLLFLINVFLVCIILMCLFFFSEILEELNFVEKEDFNKKIKGNVI